MKRTSRPTVESPVQLDAMLQQVCYAPSPYHKTEVTDGVIPRNRHDDPSKCPEHFPISEIKKMLQKSLEKGAYGSVRQGIWPKVIWFIDNQDGELAYYEARLTNREKGEYHGYPIAAAECPTQVKQLFHV